MSSSPRSPLADLKADLRGLSANILEMLQLRWELAWLEIQADLNGLKRLIFIWIMAAVMVLTALPLLATCIAETLDGRWGIATRGWLLIFGIVLLAAAPICAFAAWKWFRRRFVGLQESFEELREDLEWIKEAARGGR